MNIFSIFLLGASILIGAILVNGLANALGLPSWYTFLENTKSTSVIGYIWLFVLYPLCLGGIAYIASKWIF